MKSTPSSGFAAPTPNLDTEWWWDSLRQGRVELPECQPCAHRFFPPQPFCPECGSSDWTPAVADGRGQVYSWVVTHRAFSSEFADEIPYAIVAVDMVDGGRLIGRYIGDPTEVAAGADVQTEIYERSGVALLGFARCTRVG